MRSQSNQSGGASVGVTTVRSQSRTLVASTPPPPARPRGYSRAISLATEYGGDQSYQPPIYGSELTALVGGLGGPKGATGKMFSPSGSHLLQYIQNRSAETRRDLPTENFFTGRRVVKELKGVDARCCATVGDTVWVGEKNGVLSVWDIATGDMVERKEREERMFVTSIMSVGLYVWVGYSNGLLRVIDPENLQVLKEVKEHLGAINQFLVAFNGVSVYSCSSDFTINQWSASNVERIATLSGHTNIVRCMVLAGGVRLFSASDDKTIIEWDASMAKLRHVIKGDHKSPIRSMTATSSHLWSGAEDGSVRIFSLLGHQTNPATPIGQQPGYRVMDSTSYPATPSTRCSTARSPSLPPVMGRANNLSPLGDGGVFPTDGATSDYNKFSIMSQYNSPPHCVHVITNPHTSTVTHLRIVGSKVWSTSMGTVFIWDSESFQLEAQFKEHGGFVTCVHMVHQSNVARVWTCGSEGTIKMWNSESQWGSTLRAAQEEHVRQMEVLLADALQREEKSEKLQAQTTDDMRTLLQSSKKMSEQIGDLKFQLGSRDDSLERLEKLLADEKRRTEAVEKKFLELAQRYKDDEEERLIKSNEIINGNADDETIKAQQNSIDKELQGLLNGICKSSKHNYVDMEHLELPSYPPSDQEDAMGSYQENTIQKSPNVAFDVKGFDNLQNKLEKLAKENNYKTRSSEKSSGKAMDFTSDDTLARWMNGDYGFGLLPRVDSGDGSFNNANQSEISRSKLSFNKQDDKENESLASKMAAQNNYLRMELLALRAQVSELTLQATAGIPPSVSPRRSSSKGAKSSGVAKIDVMEISPEDLTIIAGVRKRALEAFQQGKKVSKREERHNQRNAKGMISSETEDDVGGEVTAGRDIDESVYRSVIRIGKEGDGAALRPASESEKKEHAAIATLHIVDDINTDSEMDMNDTNASYMRNNCLGPIPITPSMSIDDRAIITMMRMKYSPIHRESMVVCGEKEAETRATSSSIQNHLHSAGGSGAMPKANVDSLGGTTKSLQWKKPDSNTNSSISPSSLRKQTTSRPINVHLIAVMPPPELCHTASDRLDIDIPESHLGDTEVYSAQKIATLTAAPMPSAAVLGFLTVEELTPQEAATLNRIAVEDRKRRLRGVKAVNTKYGSYIDPTIMSHNTAKNTRAFYRNSNKVLTPGFHTSESTSPSSHRSRPYVSSNKNRLEILENVIDKALPVGILLPSLHTLPINEVTIIHDIYKKYRGGDWAPFCSGGGVSKGNEYDDKGSKYGHSGDEAPISSTDGIDLQGVHPEFDLVVSARKKATEKEKTRKIAAAREVQPYAGGVEYCIDGVRADAEAALAAVLSEHEIAKARLKDLEIEIQDAHNILDHDALLLRLLEMGEGEEAGQRDLRERKASNAGKKDPLHERLQTLARGLGSFQEEVEEMREKADAKVGNYENMINTVRGICTRGTVPSVEKNEEANEMFDQGKIFNPDDEDAFADDKLVQRAKQVITGKVNMGPKVNQENFEASRRDAFFRALSGQIVNISFVPNSNTNMINHPGSQSFSKLFTTEDRARMDKEAKKALAAHRLAAVKDDHSDGDTRAYAQSPTTTGEDQAVIDAAHLAVGSTILAQRYLDHEKTIHALEQQLENSKNQGAMSIEVSQKETSGSIGVLKAQIAEMRDEAQRHSDQETLNDALIQGLKEEKEKLEEMFRRWRKRDYLNEKTQFEDNHHKNIQQEKGNQCPKALQSSPRFLSLGNKNNNSSDNSGGETSRGAEILADQIRNPPTTAEIHREARLEELLESAKDGNSQYKQSQQTLFFQQSRVTAHEKNFYSFLDHFPAKDVPLEAILSQANKDTTFARHERDRRMLIVQRQQEEEKAEKTEGKDKDAVLQKTDKVGGGSGFKLRFRPSGSAAAGAHPTSTSANYDRNVKNIDDAIQRHEDGMNGVCREIARAYRRSRLAGFKDSGGNEQSELNLVEEHNDSEGHNGDLLNKAKEVNRRQIQVNQEVNEHTKGLSMDALQMDNAILRADLSSAQEAFNKLKEETRNLKEAVDIAGINAKQDPTSSAPKKSHKTGTQGFAERRVEKEQEESAMALLQHAKGEMRALRHIDDEERREILTAMDSDHYESGNRVRHESGAMEQSIDESVQKVIDEITDTQISLGLHREQKLAAQIDILNKQLEREKVHSNSSFRDLTIADQERIRNDQANRELLIGENEKLKDHINSLKEEVCDLQNDLGESNVAVKESQRACVRMSEQIEKLQRIDDEPYCVKYGKRKDIMESSSRNSSGSDTHRESSSRNEYEAEHDQFADDNGQAQGENNRSSHIALVRESRMAEMAIRGRLVETEKLLREANEKLKNNRIQEQERIEEQERIQEEERIQDERSTEGGNTSQERSSSRQASEQDQRSQDPYHQYSSDTNSSAKEKNKRKVVKIETRKEYDSESCDDDNVNIYGSGNNKMIERADKATQANIQRKRTEYNEKNMEDSSAYSSDDDNANAYGSGNNRASGRSNKEKQANMEKKRAHRKNMEDSSAYSSDDDNLDYDDNNMQGSRAKSPHVTEDRKKIKNQKNVYFNEDPNIVSGIESTDGTVERKSVEDANQTSDLFQNIGNDGQEMNKKDLVNKINALLAELAAVEKNQQEQEEKLFESENQLAIAENQCEKKENELKQLKKLLKTAERVSQERLDALEECSVENDYSQRIAADTSYANDEEKEELERKINDLEDQLVKASEDERMSESLVAGLRSQLEDMNEQNGELEEELEELRATRDKLLKKAQSNEEALQKGRNRESALIGSLQQKGEEISVLQRKIQERSKEIDTPKETKQNDDGDSPQSPSFKEGEDGYQCSEDDNSGKKDPESNFDTDYATQARHEIEELEDYNTQLKEDLSEKDKEIQIIGDKLKDNRREMKELKSENKDLKRQMEVNDALLRKSKVGGNEDVDDISDSRQLQRSNLRRTSDSQRKQPRRASDSHQDHPNNQQGGQNRYGDHYDSIINQYKKKQAELEAQLAEALAAASDATALYELQVERVKQLEDILKEKEDDQWYQQSRKKEVQRLNDLVGQLEDDINHANGGVGGKNPMYRNNEAAIDKLIKGGSDDQRAAAVVEDQRRIMNRWVTLEKQLTDPTAVRNYDATMDLQRKDFTASTAAALNKAGTTKETMKETQQRVMTQFDDAVRYHREREKKWRDLALAQRQLQNANGRIIVESSELASKLRNLSYLYETRPILVRSLYELHKLNGKMIKTNEGFRKIVSVRPLSRKEAMDQNQDLHEEFEVSKEGIRWIIANLFTAFELNHIGASPSLFVPDGRRPTWRDITIPDRYQRLKEFQRAEDEAGYGTYFRSRSPKYGTSKMD